MTKHWPVQDAKAKFSELLNSALENGPQIITRRGVETAVLVPIEEWRQRGGEADSAGATQRPTLKELLLSDPRRFDLELPARGSIKHRDPPTFE